MLLKVKTDKSGHCVITEEDRSEEKDRIEGERAIVIRSAEILWHVEIKEDGFYPLF